MLSAVLLAAALVTPACAEPDSLHIALNYDGSLYLKVLDVTVDQTLDEHGFQASAHIKTSGVLSLLHRINLKAESQGRFERDIPAPKSFSYVNLDGRKNRRVSTFWSGADVATQSQPQFGSLGDPPASREQKLEAADPLTVLARMTVLAPGERPCEGVGRFFDGKQRYDVVFRYHGPSQPDARERRLGLTSTVRCSLSFHEVAGFKRKPADQRNQGLRREVALSLGRLNGDGPWVVSSLTADTILGAAHIDLVNVSVSGSTAILARTATHGETLARR